MRLFKHSNLKVKQHAIQWRCTAICEIYRCSQTPRVKGQLHVISSGLQVSARVCVCVWERVYMKWRVIVPDCRAHSRHSMLSLQSQCSQCSNQKSGGFWRAANQYRKHHRGQRSDSLTSHTTPASHSQPFLLSISLRPPLTLARLSVSVLLWLAH